MFTAIDPRVPTIATQVRELGERFARAKGYGTNLVSMCSTVSAGLEVALQAAGLEASMVCGDFVGAGFPQGHFWVEHLDVTPFGKLRTWLIDCTATQFADAQWQLRPRRVVIARYGVGYGQNYTLAEEVRNRVEQNVMPYDKKDVSEFVAFVRREMCISASSPV